MSAKLPAQESRQTVENETSSLKHVKAIRADAFDQFIEEQLQRTQLESNNTEFEVVCHVY
jgi:hypothetical protein